MNQGNISDNTGEGTDRMINEDLRWQWQWLRQCELSQSDPDDNRRLPCQVCFAETTTKLGNWRFEVIDWHDGYEVSVRLHGEEIVSREGIPSRPEAQKLAETLVVEFAKQIVQEFEEPQQ